MIQLYTNPFLLDYIKICARLPEDQKAQIEAIFGEPFDIDGAAIGAAQTQGPKWLLKNGDEPIAIGGFVYQRKGVWRDFMLTTPEAWTDHWFALSRHCRRAMDAMLNSGQAHRLECISLANRKAAHKWYRILGYNLEGTLYGYCASGADAVLYSRVKH